jgi:hypothetical protein
VKSSIERIEMHESKLNRTKIAHLAISGNER